MIAAKCPLRPSTLCIVSRHSPQTGPPRPTAASLHDGVNGGLSTQCHLDCSVLRQPPWCRHLGVDRRWPRRVRPHVRARIVRLTKDCRHARLGLLRSGVCRGAKEKDPWPTEKCVRNHQTRSVKDHRMTMGECSRRCKPVHWFCLYPAIAVARMTAWVVRYPMVV